MCNVTAYELAKAAYAKYGVDTDAAIASSFKTCLIAEIMN